MIIKLKEYTISFLYELQSILPGIIVLIKTSVVNEMFIFRAHSHSRTDQPFARAFLRSLLSGFTHTWLPAAFSTYWSAISSP